MTTLTEFAMFTCLFLLVISSISEAIERRAEIRRRKKAEEDAGRFLVDQVANAPEGATIILGAATYRLPDTVRISKGGIALMGAPGHTSRLLMERDRDIIHVLPTPENTADDIEPTLAGCQLTGLYLEHRGSGGAGIHIEDTREGRVDDNTINIH